MLTHQTLRSSQLVHSGSLDWYLDVFLTTNTLQSALIIVLLVAACGLAIYNLPWTDSELKATHKQTQAQLNKLIGLFSLNASTAKLPSQHSRHVGLDA